ncbi:MAG: PspC domain-containing protein [Deltaproteobacteria bacterium]|nr:PspC domain-containing protein [Deltaproteobacteria bacterium]
MNRRPTHLSPLGVDRPLEGRILAGVCAGLAERFQVDATLLRLAALILLLASGLGLLFYLVLWALTPSRGQETAGLLATLRANARGLLNDLRHIGTHAAIIWTRPDAPSTWPRPLSRRWLAIAAIFLGFLILLLSLGLFGWLTVPRVIALLLIVIGASVLVARAPELRR